MRWARDRSSSATTFAETVGARTRLRVVRGPGRGRLALTSSTSPPRTTTTTRTLGSPWRPGGTSSSRSRWASTRPRRETWPTSPPSAGSSSWRRSGRSSSPSSTSFAGWSRTGSSARRTRSWPTSGEYFAAEHRIMRADLAGGPMNDLMTYPAALATWLLGQSLRGCGRLDASHRRPSAPAGSTARSRPSCARIPAPWHPCTASVLGDLPTTASVVGSQATLLLDRLLLPARRVHPVSGTAAMRCGTTRRASTTPALFWQAAEAARRIAAGETVTPLRTPADTITTLETMDAIRAAAQRSSTTISSA